MDNPLNPPKLVTLITLKLGGEYLKKYRKVIVSNHVIEVYEYERMPGPKTGITEVDDYDPFDLENVKVEDRGDRTKERRQQTVRDARNVTRRLTLMNFNSGDKFLTLTFDPKKFEDGELRDVEFVDKEFKKFIQRFNYRYKCKLKYLAVREFHKSGRLHFHMVCDWKDYFQTEEEIREAERFIGEKVWKNGFVDIKQMDQVDNVGAYIIKYMTKDLPQQFFKGHKMYLPSKGLERPLIYNDYEAEMIISTYELEQKKEVFTNSYESEYLGKIVYKEYNLKRT